MRCRDDDARRWPGGSRAGAGQAATLSLYPNQAKNVASRSRVPFDLRLSRELDDWQEAQAELVSAFQSVRRAYAARPGAQHLPRLLARVLWAFIETVDSIRSLEDGVGI